MLSVVRRLPDSRYLCVCDCGNERVVAVGHFNTRKIKSCGCHKNHHGHAKAGARSRTYVCYHNMMARCHKPSNKRYKDYGAAGIFVCDEWRESFVTFLADMGECPDGYTIDRVDNRKGYSKDNCCWVSRKKNQANRAISVVWVVDGACYQTASEAGRHYGVADQTIRAWCKGRFAEGRYYPPRKNCMAIKKYGAFVTRRTLVEYEKEGLIHAE